MTTERQVQRLLHDHLRIGQVAAFCGRTPRSLKRYQFLDEFGTRTAGGQRDYTFLDAIAIFTRLYTRRPTTLEFAALLASLGNVDDDDRQAMEDDRGFVMKFFARGLLDSAS